MSNLAYRIRDLESAFHRTTLTLYRLDPPYDSNGGRHEYVVLHTMDMQGMYTTNERHAIFGDKDPLAVNIFPSTPEGTNAGAPIHDARGTLSHDNALAGIGYHIAGRSFGR